MAADQELTPFGIRRKEPLLVKPSKPIPNCHNVLSLSKIDNYDFLEKFRHILYVYSNSNKVQNDHQPLISDPVSLLKQGLARTLDFYYPLAGKIKRRPDRSLCITFNAEEDDGVPFLEAAVDCDLRSLNYMDGNQISAFASKDFIFNQPINQKEPYDPLRLQVTVFSCGGFVIGMSMLHSVCDAFGTAQFFKALAELAGGKLVEPSVIPVWERESLKELNVRPDEDNNIVVSPAGAPPHQNIPVIEMETINEFINISSDGIRRLKLELAREMGVDEAFSPTTFEALSAYIWRSRFKALESNPRDQAVFVTMLGLRNRLDDPKLPNGYYGNAVTLSSPVFVLGSDLLEGPLSNIVKLMRETKKISSEPKYIRFSLGRSARGRSEHLKTIVSCGGGVMFVTDWRQLGLPEKQDFGWGGCVNVVPVVEACNSMGNKGCILLPPLTLDHSMKNGVKIFIGLPKAAMDIFKQEIRALHNPITHN